MGTDPGPLLQPERSKQAPGKPAVPCAPKHRGSPNPSQEMETAPCHSRTVTRVSGQDPAGVLRDEKPTPAIPDVLGKPGTHAAVQGSPSSLGSSQRASQAALRDRASWMAEKGQVSGQNICPAAAARAVRPSLYPISRLGCDSRGCCGCSGGCKSVFTAWGESGAGPSPQGAHRRCFGGCSTVSDQRFWQVPTQAASPAALLPLGKAGRKQGAGRAG